MIILLNKIIIENIAYFNRVKNSQRIIVDINPLLFWYLAQGRANKIKNNNQVIIIVLNLEASLLELHGPQRTNANFVDSEMAAVDLRLESLNNRQQQDNLKPKSVKNEGNDNIHKHEWAAIDLHLKSLFSHCRDQRTDALIAKVVGFDSIETYNSAKQVYLQGIPALINAMDYEKISISKAAELAALSTPEQQQQLENLDFFSTNSSFNLKGIPM